MKYQSPEQVIKNDILSWLNTLPQCFVWPVDSVGIFDPVKKIYRQKNSKFHIRGVSDILGVYKGLAIAIEVKSAVGRVSDHQKYFLTRFESTGGFSLVARSVEDVKQFIMRIT